MSDGRADVSPGATAVLKAIAARLDTDLATLASGPFDLEHAEAHGMDWDTFCALGDALLVRAGSPEALATHGSCAITVPELGPSIRILRTVVGCQGLYWANFRWGGPSLFRTVKTTFVVRRDGTYVGTIALPDGARHSEGFFHICAGVFRSLPRVLGLDEAHIEVRVSPGHATYLVEPPATRSWFAYARWVARAIWSSSELVDRLAEQNLRLTEERRVADEARAEAEAARRRAEESLTIAEERRIEAEEARVTAEAARAQADEALRLRNEFVGTVSHELRTPLNGILGMGQILLDRPLPRDVRDQVTTIATSGRVLLGLINELLDFSKIEAGKLTLDPQPCELRTVVEQTMTGAAARALGRPIELVGHVEPSVPDTLLLDGNRLRQVLANLVDNAVKFTTEGHVHLRVELRDGALRFSVTDTGIGIAGPDQSRVFQPFVQADGSTTRRFGGTGLGLSIAQALVGLMGGRIELQSQVGVGSVFSFALPTMVPPVRRRADRSPVAVFADPPLREAIQAALATLGHPIGPPADVWIVDLDAKGDPPIGVDVVILASRSPVTGGRALRKPISRADLTAAIAAAGVPDRPDPHPQARVALRVGLIDDDPVHRGIVELFLRKLGHTPSPPAEADVVLVCGDDPAAVGDAAAASAAPGVRAAGLLRPTDLGAVDAALRG